MINYCHLAYNKSIVYKEVVRKIQCLKDMQHCYLLTLYSFFHRPSFSSLVSIRSCKHQTQKSLCTMSLHYLSTALKDLGNYAQTV